MYDYSTKCDVWPQLVQGMEMVKTSFTLWLYCGLMTNSKTNCDAYWKKDALIQNLIWQTQFLWQRKCGKKPAYFIRFCIRFFWPEADGFLTGPSLLPSRSKWHNWFMRVSLPSYFNNPVRQLYPKSRTKILQNALILFQSLMQMILRNMFEKFANKPKPSLFFICPASPFSWLRTTFVCPIYQTG